MMTYCFVNKRRKYFRNALNLKVGCKIFQHWQYCFYTLGPILRRSALGKNSPKIDLSKISQSDDVDDEMQGDG